MGWRYRSIPARGRWRSCRRRASELTPLAASSADSYVIANRLGDQTKAKSGPRASQIIALAAEGRLNGSAAAPFRMIVAGDADFASNSFFPYLANSDAVLAGLAWLTREERAPAMKPPVEVLPTVSLTGEQMRGIFLVTVLLDSRADRIRRQRDVVVAAMSRLVWAAAALGATGFPRGTGVYRRTRWSRA